MGIVSLTTYSNYNSLGNDINIVGTFSTDASKRFTDKHVSAPLLNYVEPYVYEGTTKTLFYTEVNSNLKVGDRVFIINGNYDSAELIKRDKYKKGTDGYIILVIDRCQVVLDIDYTGNPPNIDGLSVKETPKDYVKVYYIDSYDTFVSANRQLTTRGGYMGGKFDYYQNNVIYVDYDYPTISDGWTRTAGITASPGFFVREPAYDPNLLSGSKGEVWRNITNEWLTGSFSYASSDANPKSDLRFYNNQKMMVMERNFSFRGKDYLAGNTYKWDSDAGEWMVDIKKASMYGTAVLTKLNFRDGDMEGNFYSGVYGSRNKRIRWTGKGTWYGGTLLNTSWVKGSMFSTITLEESWTANTEFGTDNLLKASQKLNTYNNGGYGFNYILESDFESTSIYSAIVRNTRFGITPSLTVVEDYIKSTESNFEHILDNGLFESCEFNNTKLIGGAVKNSRSRNSLMYRVKHINSWARDVVFNKSTLIADSVIKIFGYDEWTASEKRGSSVFGATFSESVDFKVYKFYIGEADYLKLKSKDSFYIKGLRILNNPELLNIFDRKFTIGNWTEYVDDFNSTGGVVDQVLPNSFYKKGISCAAFLVSPEENEYIYNSISFDYPVGNTYINKGYLTDVLSKNPNNYHSIDIFVSTLGIDLRGVNDINFNYSTQSVSSLTYLRPKISGKNVIIDNAYIIDSHIESGLVDNSIWNSGYDIAYNKDLTITSLTNSNAMSTYNAVTNGDGSVTFTTLSDTRTEINNPYSLSQTGDMNPGDVIFITGLDYYSKGKVLEISITNPGSGYVDSSQPVGLSYSGASASHTGRDLMVNYTTVNGKVNSVDISEKGLDYKVGDVLYLRVDNQGSLSVGGFDKDAHVTVTAVDTTEPVRLPDSWKVVQYYPPTLVAEPIHSIDVVKGLTDSGIFFTTDAANRWGRFSRTKINATNIQSGIFRRSVLTNNIIENTDVDPIDRDFRNPEALKSLVVSDVVFANNGNRLSNAIYNNSSLVGGTDEWIDGIVYRSVLNKMTFNKGLIKESSWLDGTFNGGLFYLSKSYDGKPQPGSEFYYINRVLSNYKSGSTYGTTSNDRYSWRKGEFNGGEFYKSDWEDGIFNEGLFRASKWYDGTAKGGRFGDLSTATGETLFYNGTVDFTTVDNATFIATDTSMTGVTNSLVWNDGIFNKGIFGASRTYLTKITTNPAKIFAIVQSTGTILNGQTKTYTVIAAGNYTSVTQIDVKLNITTSNDISIYRITLVSPAGKKILIKDYKTGYGFEINDGIFSTDLTNIGIDSVSSPLNSRMRFCVVPYVDATGSFISAPGYVQNISDLISGGSTNGSWKVEVSAIEATSILEFEAELVFYSADQNIPYIQNSAIWHNGTFNGGEFANYAYWRNGEFNNGKFTSTAGWELSGSYSINGPSYSHSWHTGNFNGGEFGNSEMGANSTWYTGVFNGGEFNGRVWNSGIFKNGTFNGTGKTASGGWKIETVATQSYALDFVDSYTSSFYGLWRNGLVTDREDASLVPGSNWTNLVPNSVVVNNKRTTYMQSILWMDGVFEHSDGTIQNSVWIAGTFSKGTFQEGSFNPYVRRLPNRTSDFGDAAVWENGTFVDGDFFFSEWKRGEFISGTGFGMWFQDGVAYYMNAHNVTWGGTASYPKWKNGNWDGSSLDYIGSITNPMYIRIIDKANERNKILNLSSLHSSSGKKIHIWNIFEDQSVKNTFVIGAWPPNLVETKIVGYTPGDQTTIWYPPVVW